MHDDQRRAPLTTERARSAAAVLARHAEADHEALAMLARAKLVELLEETGGIYAGDPRTVADRMRSALAAALDRAIISPLEVEPLPSLTWQGLASVDPRVVSRRRLIPGDLPLEVRTDPTIPPGTVELRLRGRTVGKIVNLEDPHR